MNALTTELVQECKTKLLETKMELLNRVRETQQELLAPKDRSGDEADQSSALISENETLITQERLRRTLMEIEGALARIQNGTFGVCEETEEPIEAERLLAIPWTRLSIEGAEMRESQEHRRVAR